MPLPQLLDNLVDFSNKFLISVDHYKPKAAD